MLAVRFLQFLESIHDRVGFTILDWQNPVLPAFAFCKREKHLVFSRLLANDQVGFPMPEFLTVFSFRWTFLDAAAELFLVLSNSTCFGATAKLFGKMVVSCFHQTQINVVVQGFRTYNLRTFEFTA